MEDHEVDVPPRVLNHLGQQLTMTLATASPTGVPRATMLHYVNDDLVLYVWMRSESWTARQIEQNPLVSFTIASEASVLQGLGQARVVLSGDEIARAVELFSDKFPAALGTSTMNVSFFRIAPTDLKLVDETYAGGRGETQMFANAEYRVDHVYSVVRDLPPSEVGIIAGRLQRADFTDGEEVVRAGMPADNFMIVLDGELEVLREVDGETQPVTTLGSGDFFGEVAILRETPRTVTLRAKGRTSVLTMDSDEFNSVVAQALGAPEDFVRIVRERLGGGEGS